MSELYLVIDGKVSFDYSETFEIYQACAKELLVNENQAIGILVRILNHRSKFDARLNEMLTDLIEAIGFYPYLAHESLELTSAASMIRLASSHSRSLPNRVFHDEQKLVSDIIASGKNLVVSAPTSFGKSLLIEEAVASLKFKNIVIIQPTLALLDETRKKLSKYRDNYKLIVRTSQKPEDGKGTIFLLTAERVNEYREFPSIDFVVVDEFYKLSARRDDERADSLNNALLYLLRRFQPQFYLAGPNIDNVSEEFLRKYNAIFFATNYSLVGTDVIDVYKDHENQFGDRGKKKAYKESVLFQMLDSAADEQTLVYCASPARARSLARAYLGHLVEAGYQPRNTNLPIHEWIAENVSPLWSLIDLLKYGIAFHDGALQRHITSTVIEYFSEKTIHVLFCTATIIEGVNTNAKNVIYFDQRKGNDVPIDYFDYANIRGRAGRMMEHYVGRVFNFGEIPKKDSIYIDIPFIDQSPIADEVLINLNEDEVLNRDTEQYKFISDLSPSVKELFTTNSIYLKGQQQILSKLRDSVKHDAELICWDGTPTYEQLAYTLGLAWDYLLKPGEKVNPMTKARIVKLTFDYGFNKSINHIVQSAFKYMRGNEKYSKKTDAVLMDDAIRDSFQIMRYWFQYKIPKWLVVLDRIQRFVCEEKGMRPGSYVFYASLLENDFIRENLSILAEFGIPRSAIVKLEKHIKPDLNQDAVLSAIITRRLASVPQLTAYERAKLKLALE